MRITTGNAAGIQYERGTVKKTGRILQNGKDDKQHGTMLHHLSE
jgi:hypothetical protein